MSRHRISSVIRLSYWCVTNYVLSQQRFPMNIWQNKFRVPLHEEPLNYLVRATATAQSSPLSCWGTKRDKDASWANGGAVFVFVFNVAFVVVFVAVFGGGQRETKMQVGQTAALAVLLSIKGISLIHSSLWHLLDHLQNLSLSFDKMYKKS